VAPLLVLASALLAAAGPAAALATPRLPADPAAALAAPARGTVAVTVSGVRSRAGSLRAKLVRSGEGFPGSDEHVVAKQRRAIEGGSVRFVFEGVPYGDYAVVCLHDEDDDASLDRTRIGLPAEGVGFSSGARVRFGPPGFEEARFELLGPALELAIEMQYGL
jgi:uncharacterized protein (DUF2141 family)